MVWTIASTFIGNSSNAKWSFEFSTGYILIDLPGDYVVNLNDLLAGYNNSVKFVSEMRR